MKKEPLASILVPVYNMEKFLDECIDSIQAQTYSNIEVIIVNDGSTDCSSHILERRCIGMQNVRVIVQPNSGVAEARNTAIDNASGEYLFFLDPDDTLPTDAIEVMMNKFITTDADIVRGEIVRFSENGDKPFGRRFPEDIEAFRSALVDWGIFPLGLLGGGIGVSYLMIIN